MSDLVSIYNNLIDKHDRAKNIIASTTGKLEQLNEQLNQIGCKSVKSANDKLIKEQENCKIIHIELKEKLDSTKILADKLGV